MDCLSIGIVLKKMKKNPSTRFGLQLEMLMKFLSLKMKNPALKTLKEE